MNQIYVHPDSYPIQSSSSEEKQFLCVSDNQILTVTINTSLSNFPESVIVKLLVLSLEQIHASRNK